MVGIQHELSHLYNYPTTFTVLPVNVSVGSHPQQQVSRDAKRMVQWRCKYNETLTRFSVVFTEVCNK